MSQPNRKRQHLEQEENGNGNELREPELKMAALETKNGVLSESLANVKEENKALGEKLKEAEQKAQMAKNELEKIIQQQKNPEKLKALLANVIDILKEEQKEETTSSRGELEITKNSSDRHRIPLPLELNCQIFECLKFGIQRKFIGGLGRGIYAIFRLKVLTKCKILRNPKQNGWEVSNTDAIIDSNGLLVNGNTGIWQFVSATKGFPISVQLSRTDNFPGTILYYFEVTEMASSYGIILVGLSSGNILNGSFVDLQSNSYAFQFGCNYCWLSGKKPSFEWPNGAIKPKFNGQSGVVGCGIRMDPDNKLSIFFTGNGILMGKPIPINSTVDTLYPTVSMYGNGSVEANFGGNPVKPFNYDIDKCPQMGFE